MPVTAVEPLQAPEEHRSRTSGDVGASEPAPTLVLSGPARAMEGSGGVTAGVSPTLERPVDDVAQVIRPVSQGTSLPKRLALTVPLQEWEGVVDWVEDEEFGGTLVDMTAPEVHEQEQDTFSMEEVSRDDCSLVMPGAVFYWTIALVTNEVGRRSYESFIRLRRLPAWRPQDLGEARDRGARLARQLNLP